MVGGIGAHLALYKWILAKGQPLFDSQFWLPDAQDLDKHLLIGAALFGMGWGLGGYCPGPALVSVASGVQEPLAFTAAMVMGMFIKELVFSRYHTATGLAVSYFETFANKLKSLKQSAIIDAVCPMFNLEPALSCHDCSGTSIKSLLV